MVPFRTSVSPGGRRNRADGRPPPKPLFVYRERAWLRERLEDRLEEREEERRDRLVEPAERPLELFVRPSERRFLFTVAAAICFARAEECFPLSLSLMCSYWRSSLSLQLFGMTVLRS